MRMRDRAIVIRLWLSVWSLWCAVDPSLVMVTVTADSLPDGNNNNVKLSEHGLQLTQTLNMQRQEFLQQACKLMGYENASLEDLNEQQMDHLLVDPSHKFLYCYVPKVACTNWKRVLMIMTGAWKNGTDPLEIPASLAHSVGIFQKLSSLQPDERRTVISDYTRLIITRHPFERLLSAYRNKLEGNSSSARYFQTRIGKTIVKSFRENPSNESLELGHDVSFEEFIKYLLTPNLSMGYQANQSFNEHWEPAANLCHPCIIKYNVVGKYETLLDDSALALYLANATNVSFPTGHKPSGTSSQLRKYFEPIPVGAIRKLYEIYEDDFRLFDYGLENVLGFEFG